MRPMTREDIEMESVPKTQEIEPSEESDFAGSVGNGILKLKNEAKVSNWSFKGQVILKL